MTSILDQLNTYQGDNIWQDVILPVEDTEWADRIDTGDGEVP